MLFHAFRCLSGILAVVLALAGALSAFAQEPAGRYDPQQEYPIELEPPGPKRLFRLESEQALIERVRQEARDRGERAIFPPPVELPDQDRPYRPGRPWHVGVVRIVPNYVCYHPLYFEEKNTERYGWDWSIFQPIVSTGAFYADVLIFPYNVGVLPPWACECNAGYFLPGDPVPYYFYVPPFSWKGAALQTSVIAGGIAVFP
ncbi:MAG: hypothetical protein NZM31_09460 [Gemmatales bacterium]|nr:hypothetical protein [Gemmatales bacterium]MDW8387221.1 hypothetical protein [Gemmatales bacterium]